VHLEVAVSLQQPCPAADILSAFAAGELSTDEVAALELHLADCAECLATVAYLGRDVPLIAALSPGALVDRYQILSFVGRGSFGLVYAAFDPKLDRRVALKLLHGDGGTGEDRFLGEVRAMAKVSDPGVVAIYDAGQFENRSYIAMEFIDGATLRAWLADKPRDLDAITSAFIQAGRGLAAAHAAGVIHRDFKPDNVLVRGNGTVAVSDFGLAERAGRSSSEDEWLVGTPAYMAPEALRREAVDVRADVYSFCVSLYEASFGTHPFPAGSIAELLAAIERGPRIPRDSRLPRHVREVVLAGLASTPSDRPQSMGLLLRALQHDPRSKRRWIAGAAIAVAATTALVVRSTQTSDPASSCSVRAHDQINAIWGPSRRAAVRGALESSKSPIGRDAGARVEIVLDRYAASLQTAWIGACEARESKSSPADLTQRRINCLERRREHLAALAETLAHPDERTVLNASTATYALPAVETCGGERWLPGQSPHQADSRFSEAHAALANAQVLADLGHTAEGLAALVSPLELARETGDRALEAEARLVEGDLRRAVEPRAAEAPLHAAAIAASAAGRLDLEAAAKILLVQTLAHSQLRLDEVALAAKYAEAVVDRLGDPIMTADYRYSRALAEWSIGGSGRSLPFDIGTLIAQLSVHGEDHPKTAEAQNNLAVSLFELERLDLSIALERRALETRERLQGREHPETLNAQGNLAYAFAERGEIAEAVRLQESVAAGRERLFGADYFLLSETWLRLSRLYQWELGRPDDAVRAARQALAIDAKEFGEDASESIASAANLARILAAHSEHVEADRISARALAVADKNLPPDHLLARTALLARGYALERGGRCNDAVPLLERLDRLSADVSTGRSDLSAGLQALARCRIALGDLPAAVTLLVRAVTLREETRGAQSPLVADALIELSAFYRAQRRRAEAITAAERAVRLRANIDGAVLERARLELARATASSD
jgi:tRNA A-37 threonylcarbamoyl transferase component Bud32/tetratricopeptide (TPR) repeat protein